MPKENHSPSLSKSLNDIVLSNPIVIDEEITSKLFSNAQSSAFDDLTGESKEKLEEVLRHYKHTENSSYPITVAGWVVYVYQKPHGHERFVELRTCFPEKQKQASILFPVSSVKKEHSAAQYEAVIRTSLAQALGSDYLDQLQQKNDDYRQTLPALSPSSAKTSREESKDSSEEKASEKRSRLLNIEKVLAQKAPPYKNDAIATLLHHWCFTADSTLKANYEQRLLSVLKHQPVRISFQRSERQQVVCVLHTGYAAHRIVMSEAFEADKLSSLLQSLIEEFYQALTREYKTPSDTQEQDFKVTYFEQLFLLLQSHPEPEKLMVIFNHHHANLRSPVVSSPIDSNEEKENPTSEEESLATLRQTLNQTLSVLTPPAKKLFIQLLNTQNLSGLIDIEYKRPATAEKAYDPSKKIAKLLAKYQAKIDAFRSKYESEPAQPSFPEIPEHKQDQELLNDPLYHLPALTQSLKARINSDSPLTEPHYEGLTAVGYLLTHPDQIKLKPHELQPALKTLLPQNLPDLPEVRQYLSFCVYALITQQASKADSDLKKMKGIIELLYQRGADDSYMGLSLTHEHVKSPYQSYDVISPLSTSVDRFTLSQHTALFRVFKDIKSATVQRTLANIMLKNGCNPAHMCRVHIRDDLKHPEGKQTGTVLTTAKRQGWDTPGRTAPTSLKRLIRRYASDAALGDIQATPPHANISPEITSSYIRVFKHWPVLLVQDRSRLQACDANSFDELKQNLLRDLTSEKFDWQSMIGQKASADTLFKDEHAAPPRYIMDQGQAFMHLITRACYYCNTERAHRLAVEFSQKILDHHASLPLVPLQTGVGSREERPGVKQEHIMYYNDLLSVLTNIGITGQKIFIALCEKLSPYQWITQEQITQLKNKGWLQQQNDLLTAIVPENIEQDWAQQLNRLPKKAKPEMAKTLEEVENWEENREFLREFDKVHETGQKMINIAEDFLSTLLGKETATPLMDMLYSNAQQKHSAFLQHAVHNQGANHLEGLIPADSSPQEKDLFRHMAAFYADHQAHAEQVPPSTQMARQLSSSIAPQAAVRPPSQRDNGEDCVIM